MGVFDKPGVRLSGGRLLTAEEACGILHMDRPVLESMVRYGAITPYDDHGMVFERSGIDRYLEERRIRDSYMAELYATTEEFERLEREAILRERNDRKP